MIDEHISRLRSSLSDQYGVHNLAAWIEKNTYLNGRKFSFKNYEFQIPIINDTAKTSITIKPAQVGLSELSYRLAVAYCCTQEDFTCIYTFPTATDAENNNRQRIDPMIEASPAIKRLVDPAMNNSEAKKFGSNSFLMFKGTKSATQALSTPANAVIHDEVDKSDITQMSVYVSRLQNRPHKIRKMFSTPTVAKFGISKEAETAKRMKHLATCAHCNHTFLPDYFSNIVIPGWDKPMEEVTKRNIHTLRWQEATLQCPKCKLDPVLHHSRMEYVCENPSEAHDANAWYVSPFSAHGILTPAYMVKASTQFEKYSEFKNQTLGLTAEEKNDQIQADDIQSATIQADLQTSGFHVMGSDMGLTCHVVIGRLTREDIIVIVHREKVHYTLFEMRIRELTAKYRVVMHVMDSQPYTDLVTRISASRPNSFGAVFVRNASTLPFTVHAKPEDTAAGKMDLKLVKVNRNVALDALLGVVKRKELVIQSSQEDDSYLAQMQSLKRVQRFDDNNLTYVWEKTDEDDHYHFATLYFWLAVQMRGMAGGTGAVSAGVPMVSAVRGPSYQPASAVARDSYRIE